MATTSAELIREEKSRRITANLVRWGKALKAYDWGTQIYCVNEMHKWANDESTVASLAQERVLEMLGFMMATPPRETEEIAFIGQAGDALCKVLAHITQTKEREHAAEAAKSGKDDVLLCSGSVLTCVPKITKRILASLLTLLQQGSMEGQKTAAWLLHYLACNGPEGNMSWTTSQRTDSAKAMLSNLSGMFGDVRVSVLHALSMCMQKDMIFREDVAQAGGLPLFIRFLADDDITLVTATAGALHCLVQDHTVFVQQLVENAGAPELLKVIRRLPVTEPENRLALLQAIWTLELVAEISEEVAQQLVDGQAVSLLADVITQAHTVNNEIQGAAAGVLAALAMGRDFQEQRKKVREQIISELGVFALEDFRENGCKELKLVAAAFLRHLSPLHMSKSRIEPEKKKLVPLSSSQENAQTDKPTTPIEEEEEDEAITLGQMPKRKGALAVRGALTTFVGKEALVIGNSNYDHLSKVKTAVSDAQDIGKALEISGFRVLECLEANSDLLRASMAQFEQRVHPGVLVCIFFAGHGGVFDNNHYFLPVDFMPPPSVKNAALMEEKAEKKSARVKDKDTTPVGTLVPTKEDLRKVHTTAVCLDATLSKFNAKGARHTLLMLDPIRAYPKADTPRTSKSGSSPAVSSDGHAVPKSSAASTPAPFAEPSQQKDQVKIKTNHKPGNPGYEPPAKPAKAAAAIPAALQPKKKPMSLLNAATKVKAQLQVVVPPPQISLKTRMSNHLGWNYEGIDTQVALLLWAAGPGSQSLAAGRTSVSFKNSVFVEQILKHLFARHTNLRQGIEILIQNTRESTANQQIPGCKDSGLIGSEFKMYSQAVHDSQANAVGSSPIVSGHNAVSDSHNL